MGDGLVALVEEVEHFAGVELGTLAKPVAAMGLGGGEEVVGGGGGDIGLAAGGVGKAEEGHLKAGIDEEIRTVGVFDDAVVDGDGGGAIAFVFAEIGFFEAEEVVAGVLTGKGALDNEGFGVAAIVTEKKGEHGAGFDVVHEAVGGDVTEEIEAFFFVATNAGDADHEADNAGEAGDGELLDANGHFGVSVVGVNPEGLFGVVAGLEALMGGGDEGVVYQSDERRVQATGVATGEEGVLVAAVSLDLAVAQIGDLIGEGLDAMTDVVGDVDLAFGGKEAVVGVVGGVEEVLMVELAEDEDLEDVGGGEGIVGMGEGDGLEAGEGAVVVEVVEMLVGVADLGEEVEGIGVGMGRGLCGESEGGQDCSEEQGESSAEAWSERQRAGAGGWDGLKPRGVMDGWWWTKVGAAGDSVNYRREGRRRGSRGEHDVTRTELLRLVVAQSRSQGFRFRRWYVEGMGMTWTSAEEAVDTLAMERRYYALLFSHDFAQNFWKAGSEMMLQMPKQSFQRLMADGTIGTVERKSHLRRMIREDAWRFHLKEMAVQEEPLRYVRRFLRVEEDLAVVEVVMRPIVIVDEEDLLPEED